MYIPEKVERLPRVRHELLDHNIPAPAPKKRTLSLQGEPLVKAVVELLCLNNVRFIAETSRNLKPNVTQFTGHAAVQQKQNVVEFVEFT